MFYYFQDKHKLLEGNLEFKEHKYMFNSYEMELYSVCMYMIKKMMKEKEGSSTTNKCLIFYSDKSIYT